MKVFVCTILAAVVASSMASPTLIGSNLGLGLGGLAPLGWGSPISTIGLGYNTIGLNGGLIAPSLLNKGLISPAISSYGLGLGGIGLKANSLLLPQQRIISAPISSKLIAPYGLSPLGLSNIGLSPLGLSNLGLSPLGVSNLGLSPLGLSNLGLSKTVLLK